MNHALPARHERILALAPVCETLADPDLRLYFLEHRYGQRTIEALELVHKSLTGKIFPPGSGRQRRDLLGEPFEMQQLPQTAVDLVDPLDARTGADTGIGHTESEEQVVGGVHEHRGVIAQPHGAIPGHVRVPFIEPRAVELDTSVQQLLQ